MNVPSEMTEDFRNHLWACFKYLGLGEPTPLQYAMAEKLQHGPEGFQLQAGRGAGKSVLTACFASWLLLRDSNTTVMVMSATANKSTEFISMTRRILSLVPYCQHMEPGPNTKDNAFGFNVENRTSHGQDMSCFAKGVTGQITGSHADWVILDDVEIEKNSETAESRERLLTKVWEIEQIRNPGEGGVRILGTPQTSESIYRKMADGYPIHKFPALMPDPSVEGQIENCADYIKELDLEPGDSTQPERFPLDLLMERKAKVGPKLFSLHYHLDTTLADAERYPLKLADLVVLDLDYEVAPEKVVWASKQVNKSMPCFGLSGDVIYEPMWISQNYQPYVQKVMHIDPSGRGADETSICCSGYLNGYVFIMELLGYDGGYDEGTLKKIVQVAIETDVKLIRFESNWGDAMFGQILLPVMQRMGCKAGIEEYRVTGNKNKRIIDTLEPVMNSHRLIIDRKSIRQEKTQRQLTRITEVRGSLAHDDRVDALAASVSYWEEAMGVNVDKMIETSEIARQEAVVKDWINDERRIMAIAHDRTIGNVEVNGKEFRMQTPKPFRNRLLRKFKR